MVVAYEDEPDRELPEVMVIGPKWRPGLGLPWTVQNALRSAVIAPQALMLAPETPEQATDAAPARKLRAQLKGLTPQRTAKHFADRK